MSPLIARGAAASAVLLCLSSCFLMGEEDGTCESTPVPSPIASDPAVARVDLPRGEDVRLVWVDAVGKVLGEYVSVVSSSRYIDRHGQYQYTTYFSEAGPILDSAGRKWKVSFDGIHPYSIDPFFESRDCSGPGFISRESNSNWESRRFAFEGTVVELASGRRAYVPLPETGGPQCTPVRMRSSFNSTGKCVEKPEYNAPTYCGYAVDTLPEVPPQPQTCPPTPPLHLEARALPENERRPCDYIEAEGVASHCRASRPGSGYMVRNYSSSVLEEFYVDDAHYVWRLTNRYQSKPELSAIARVEWYYFTEPSCRGTEYIDTPPDPHQTVSIGSKAYARPPGWVSTRPQPLEAVSKVWLNTDGSRGACQSMKPTPLGTLLSLPELAWVSPPEVAPHP